MRWGCGGRRGYSCGLLAPDTAFCDPALATIKLRAGQNGSQDSGRQTARTRLAGSRAGALRIRPATRKRASTAASSSAARLKFERLARRWRRETVAFSSTIDIAMHPCYQAIIGMGEVAVPLILESLTRRFDHWFWALEAITQDNPVAGQHRGDGTGLAQVGKRQGTRDTGCQSSGCLSIFSARFPT